LAPNDPLVAAACDGALISVGRVRDAMQHLEAAARLDPLSPLFVSSYAFHLRTIGRIDEAIAAIEDASARFPDAGWVWIRRWTILFLSGRREEAERMCADDAPLPASANPNDRSMLRFAHMMFAMDFAGREAAFRSLLARDKALVLQFCAFAAEAGCVDLAYDTIFEALDTGRPLAGQALGGASMSRAFHLTTFFGFIGAAMRRDVRFPILCARFGLVDYWQESGRWPDCVSEVAEHYDFQAECENAAAKLR
jgi:hypothetical protein